MWGERGVVFGGEGGGGGGRGGCKLQQKIHFGELL